MLKKIFFPLFIITIVISSFRGCSSSEVAIQDPVVGIIKVVGNEQGKALTININEKDVYFLDCSDQLRSELLMNAGKVYEIKYRGAREIEGKIVLEVEKAIPIVVGPEKRQEKFAPGTLGAKCEIVSVKETASEYLCDIKIVSVIGYGPAVSPMGEGRIIKLYAAKQSLGNMKLEKGMKLDLQIAAPQQAMGMQEPGNWELIKIIK